MDKSTVTKLGKNIKYPISYTFYLKRTEEENGSSKVLKMVLGISVLFIFKLLVQG